MTRSRARQDLALQQLVEDLQPLSLHNRTHTPRRTTLPAGVATSTPRESQQPYQDCYRGNLSLEPMEGLDETEQEVDETILAKPNCLNSKESREPSPSPPTTDHSTPSETSTGMNLLPYLSYKHVTFNNEKIAVLELIVRITDGEDVDNTVRAAIEIERQLEAQQALRKPPTPANLPKPDFPQKPSKRNVFPGSGISGAHYLQEALATLDFDERVLSTYVLTIPLSLECTHPLLPVKPLDPSLLGMQGPPTESVSDVSDQESLNDIEDYGYHGSDVDSDCSFIPDWNYEEVNQFHILE
ncbi:hypothetical protein QAD02_003104 [Eretmocerus hayati]|uniref:Uncharacterized protein n=1 Tax=Eretmocerus hayati TaxID=131215 RepID=A0ACC2NKR3_9HYME|nr:hypothetical protein QAD02_003104 [Eretmocerus hayati]